MSLAGRHIVFALDLKDDSHQALLWLLKHIYKPGDVVHLVHVAKLKDETPEIFHGPAGTSFSYHESSQEQTEAGLDQVKQLIASRYQAFIPTNVLRGTIWRIKLRVSDSNNLSHSFNKDLDTAGVAHQTHLFLEGENAPAEDVASIIDRVYKEIQATMLVASRSNKTQTQKWFLGSVAESLSKLQHPLVLVVTDHSSSAEQAADYNRAH